MLPDQTGILIRDFTNNLRGCKFFSRLDLVKGYNQVPMSEADICKTAIVTPFGLFEFLYLPIGLKNGAQTFQRLMADGIVPQPCHVDALLLQPHPQDVLDLQRFLGTINF